jgi:hypothetical protein
MPEARIHQRPINVLGSVAEEADYHATVDAAIEAGLYNENRMERTRFFAGFVLSREEFRAVKEVKDVESLEVNPTVYAAGR